LKDTGLLMYRRVLVAITIAGLVVCPFVCHEWVQEGPHAHHHPDGHRHDAAPAHPASDCCEESSDPAGSGAPRPEDPCHGHEHSCICCGAALETRVEDTRAAAASPAFDALGQAICVSDASLSPGNSPGFAYGTLSAHASGRLVRILLQSFLA
jgi:hypothetical protein